jgi:RNA polymerase sigma factor (sigma-70 family)
MASVRAGALLRQVRRFLQGSRGEAADEDLLQSFTRNGDEAAFAALVSRHGPHVWGVCRRLLGHHQDAEDVFQATFFVLARKAGSLRNAAAVPGFLHGVAHRLSLRARADAARRRSREALLPQPTSHDSPDLSWREVRMVLDEELARLPETLRTPLILCYYEGNTQDEAARRLGWNKRTLKGRIERGRRLLRGQLARRGLELSAALAAPLLASETPAAALAEATVRAGVLLKAGQTTGVSASALELAKGGLRAMMFGKVQVLVATVAALALVGAAGVLWIQAHPPVAPPPTEPPRSEHVDRAGDPLPPGALARLGTVRFRHPGHGVKELAFLPDRKTILTVDEGSSLRYWDAASGRLLREVSVGDLSVRAVVVSPDHRLMALATFLPIKNDEPTRGAIRVLDVETGKEVRTFARKDDDTDACALAFSPDSKLLLSLGSRNGVLRVEEIASGEELLRHQFPRDVLAYLALSPDGQTLAVISGPNSRKMYVWRWQSGEEPRELKVRERAGRGLCFSPDGKILAEVSDEDSSIHLWDPATGRLLRQLEPPGPDTYWPSHVTFSPDGKTVAASGYRRGWDGAVHLWDPATGRFLRRLAAPGTSVGHLAISADGRLLAGASDHIVRVWDLTTEQEVAAEDVAHHGRVSRTAVASGVAATASDDHTVRVWDMQTGRQRLRLDHDHWVRGMALSADGKHLASSSLDNLVRLWDLQTGREVYRLPGHGEHGGRRSVSFTSDGTRFLSWGDDFYLRIWDVKTGKALREHRIRPTGVKVPDEDAEEHERERFFLGGEGAFSADGKVFVLAMGARLSVFDTDTGKEVRTLDTKERNAESVALSADGRRLLTSGWGKAIETKLPDGRTRLSTAEEHPLDLWDLTEGKLLRQITLPGTTSGPVAFSADAKTIAAAVDKPGPRVRLWDADSGAEKPAIRLPVRASALTFSPDGRFLITALEDTTALVWELEK